jgi:hypothetical protein
MKKKTYQDQLRDIKAQETTKKRDEETKKRDDAAWAQLSLQIWGCVLLIAVLASCKPITASTVIHTACGSVDIVHSNINKQTWIDFIKSICDRIRAGQRPVTGDCAGDKP